MTVLIPTHGRATLLGRTLASLAACRLPEGYVETVVVENGSRAGAEDIVTGAAETHPHLRLRFLHVERANKSHALNEALKTIADGLVVFFDDDVRLEPGVLEAYAEVAVRYDGGAFFGGPFEADYDEAPPDWLVPSLPFSVRGVRFDGGERPSEFLGFNWAAFSSDIRAVGGFDLNFGPGSPTGSSGQETEMQYRLLAYGCRAVDVPGAEVAHYVPRERCSPSYAAWWMIRRGIATSQLERARGRTKAGVLWKGTKGGARCTLAWLNKTLRRDRVGQWRALYGINFNRGLIRGTLRGSPRSK